MPTFTYTVCFFASLTFVTRCSGEIDGSLFGNVINDITNNGLGVNQIQEYYNTLSYSRAPVEGSSLALEISASLSSKFRGPIQALETLKSAVEQDISSFQTRKNRVECCQATGAVYNERFRHTVNTNEACVTISENSPSTIRYPTTRIMEVMKTNYRDNPELKWQYLGTEDGLLLNYPSFKFSTCRDYDPRFRPFYVSSATPVEKDLVVVIDTSGSMATLHETRTLIQIAKQAAISVIQTLNPNDRFSVVSFSSESKVLGSAYHPCVKSYTLSEATPINVKFFEAEINRLTPEKATNYEKALDTAFRFFESSNSSINGEKREKVILFLTDGKRTAGNDPYDLISTRNGNLGNQVVILTYGLGSMLGEEALDMLKLMASQQRSDPTKGEIRAGIFEHITDPTKLRSAMASYYNLFSKDHQQRDPTFTVPYIDLFGLGLLTSLCLPVYKPDNKLFGVVCSDLTMSNLLSDITYFRQGENSYSFIIDGRGRTLMHPLLPLPSQASDDPIYVDIQHLERANSALEIIDSMKSGLSGNKSFASTRTVSRGDVIFEGIGTKSVDSSYHWMPVSNSNFSLCIVAGTDDSQATINALPSNPEAFYYHRRDLLSAEYSNCVHFNRYATKDKSAVMINPGGFVNPSLYMEREETSREIQQYTDFFTGKTSTNPGFKPSILTSVTASYKTEEIWKAQAEGSSVIWRYIGTTDGVMRMYPAVQLPKNYDHTRRPWFARSIANKDKIVISTPYLDLWGSGYLITMSTAITESSASRSTMAVVGTDTTITYLYEKLISIPEYRVCKDGTYNCLIVDDSGFIILHKDFTDPSSATPDIENVHLTYKEPVIAADLVANNYMIKTHCIDFENIKQQFTYRISTPSGGLDRLSSYAQYEIRPVSGTNVFVVIQRNVYISPRSICCKNYGAAPDSLSCSDLSCGCLCYREADFNYCTNEYQLLADAGATCAPRSPPLETESINEAEKIRDLPLCYVTNCAAQTSRSGCHSISGCSWCSKDKYLNTLRSPYCTRQESCYFGIEGRSSCTTDDCNVPNEEEEGQKDKSSKGGVIGGTVGGVIGVVCGIAFATCICKKYRARNKNCNTNTQNSRANPNPSFANVNPAFNDHHLDSYALNRPYEVGSQTNYPQYNTQQNLGNVYNQTTPTQPSAPAQHIAPPAYEESLKHPIYP